MPNRIVIDVENRSGTKQGPGPIATATRLVYGDALSRAAEFSFDMPARDSRADLLYVKTSVVRIFDDDAQVFVGIVENLATAIDDRGRGVLTVSGRNMLAELVEYVFTPASVTLAPTYIDGTDGADVLTDYVPGWGLDSSPPSPLTGYTTTGNSMYGSFSGVSVLTGLIRLGEILGEHFIPHGGNFSDL